MPEEQQPTPEPEKPKKFSKKRLIKKGIAILVVLIVSITVYAFLKNMAIGFITGIITYLVLR